MNPCVVLNYSAVGTVLLILLIPTHDHTRGRWPWNWDGNVWLCGNWICCGIFTISSCYLPVRRLVFFRARTPSHYNHYKYRVNHPKTVVYCQDSSLLLKHAIETEGGKNPGPLPSNHTNTPCPPMPKRNEVDFIFGGATFSYVTQHYSDIMKLGPPCQSFSLANHHRVKLH